MNKRWLWLGLIILITINLNTCDWVASKVSSTKGKKKVGKLAAPSPSSAPSLGPESRPSPEIKSESIPQKGEAITSLPAHREEIASAKKEVSPRPVYITSAPKEPGGSFIGLASAETFPASLKRVVAKFNSQELAKIPRGWEIKEFTGVARAQVVNVDGVYALYLKSAGTSYSVHKNLEVDLRQTPYVTWSWRVDKMPPQGDVRHRKSDDQAAQIYIVFPFFPPVIRSKFVGYIWDSNAPRGTVLQSLNYSPARVIVVESGKENLGRWVTVTRNVYEDYKMLFGVEPPKVGKVAVSINTNHTQSSAESYFADIFFHSAPTAELK